MTDKELIKLLKADPAAGLAAVIDRYTAYLLKIARIKRQKKSTGRAA